jgi:hypothetical protein
MGEAVAFFRSDDPVLFPPAEYKHESKDANTDKDAFPTTSLGSVCSKWSGTLQNEMQARLRQLARAVQVFPNMDIHLFRVRHLALVIS